MFTDYIMPLGRDYTTQEILHFFDDLKTLGGSVAEDTKKLAKKMCGHADNISGEGDEEADSIIRTVHRETPGMYKFIKPYLVSKTSIVGLMQVQRSTKGKHTKLQNFETALSKTNMCVFQSDQSSNAFARLRVDLDKLERIHKEHGAESVFGSWTYWGDVIALREEQKEWRTLTGQEYLDQVFLDHSNIEEPESEPPTSMSINLENVVNIREMEQIVSDRSSRRPAELNALVRHIYSQWRPVESHCVKGLVAYSERYCTRHGYGRLIAQGPCTMQRNCSITRSRAYRKHAVDVDICDCHGRLLLNELKREGLYNDEEYLLIKLSTMHHKLWRQALSEYLGVSIDNAKMEILTLRYGLPPLEDIPWLRKLSAEVRMSTIALLALPKNAWLNQLYCDRPNPIFSRLSALLSFPETRNVLAIADTLRSVACEALCFMFDGAIFTCYPPFRRISIQQAIERASRDLDISVAIKPWEGETLRPFALLPAALVSRGNVSDSPVLAAEGKAVCLYSAIGNLHSRHPLSKPPSDGPFSVADFNTRMLSSNSMDSYLYLHHIHAAEFDQSSPGVLGLICHESIEEVGHFYAVRINGDEVAICDETIGVVLNTTMDGFKELAIEYDLTLFQLCETRDRSEQLHATDGVYALVGGGVH